MDPDAVVEREDRRAIGGRIDGDGEMGLEVDCSLRDGYIGINDDTRIRS